MDRRMIFLLIVHVHFILLLMLVFIIRVYISEDILFVFYTENRFKNRQTGNVRTQSSQEERTPFQMYNK